MADLFLSRDTATVKDGNGANGRLGFLQVGQLRLHTVERMDGYKWLRPGEYECEFRYWTPRKGGKKEAIRVLGSYSKGRIYIHPSNYPSQLAGCIAPGVGRNKAGVSDSRTAIKLLFEALGGFSKGRKLSLLVSGVVPKGMQYVEFEDPMIIRV